MPNVAVEPYWMLHPSSVHRKASEGMVNGTTQDSGHTMFNDIRHTAVNDIGRATVNIGRATVTSVEVAVNGHASPVAERRSLAMGKRKKRRKKKKAKAAGAPGEGEGVVKETTETTHSSKNGRRKWKTSEAQPSRGNWQKRFTCGPRRWQRMFKSDAPPYPEARLFPQAPPPGDDEDWEVEVTTPPADPYGPEDVLGAPLRSLALSQALLPDPPGPSLYTPSTDHPHPLRWVRHIQRIVAEQFEDAEE